MDDTSTCILRDDVESVNDYSHPFPHSEYHKGSTGEYLKIIIFGGLDVAGCIGASIDPLKIIFIGIGNIFADGLAMGLGEFASSKAEFDYVKSELNREKWEIDNFPQEEKTEMLNIYVDRYGFTEEDANLLVNLTFRNKTFFLKHMMVEELGLMVNDDYQIPPLKRGLAMFLSFIMFGIFPLLGFSISLLISANTYIKTVQSLTCGLSSLISLSVLGYFKGCFIGQNPFLSSLTMIATGVIASSAAFSIGLLSPI